MRNAQRVTVRRVGLPLRQQFLDELAGFAPRRFARSPLDYRLEALERRIVCAAGELDPTFGSGGLAFPPASSAGTVLMDVGLDGRIVVGTVDTGTSGSRLIRYTPDGQLDASFGGGDGVVTFEFTPPSGAWGGVEEFTDLIVLPNGKIVALGNNLAAMSNIRSALHGFNADGTVDTSFGDNGVVLLDNLGWPQLRAGSDGRIFIFGAGGTTTQDGLVLCFNGDGSPDLDFGDQGRVLLDFGIDEEIRSAAIGPAGEIVIAVMSQPWNPTPGVHIVRLTAQGQYDSTFGQGGKTFIERPNSRLVISERVCVMSDGRIVVAGAVYGEGTDGPTETFVMRLRTDGSTDTSFGDDGTVSTPQLSQLLNVQADGKLVFADTHGGPDGNNQTLLGRLTADGRPDETFGANGIRVHDLGDMSESVGGLKITPDGDILMAGTVNGAVALAQFDAGEIGALPEQPPPPEAEEPAEPPPPSAPPRGSFSDVQPVGDVEEEPSSSSSSFGAWADDLLDPDADEEDLLAGLI